MFIYQHPTDNVAGNVTPVPTTEDVTYPVANLFDRNPAKPFRFTDDEGNIVWNFGADQRIDLVSIIMHNLAPGLNVRVQMNGTDSWATPSMDVALVIPAYDLDGYPVNPWVDMTDKTGYLVAGYQFLRLLFPENPDDIALGEAWLGSLKRTLPVDLDWPIEDSVDRPIVEHTTDYRASTIYDFGVKQRSLSGITKSTTAGRTAVKQWWDSCRGRVVPHLIVPFPEDNEAFMMQFADPVRGDRREFEGYNVLDLAWREVSRGLVL